MPDSHIWIKAALLASSLRAFHPESLLQPIPDATLVQYLLGMLSGTKIPTRCETLYESDHTWLPQPPHEVQVLTFCSYFCKGCCSTAQYHQRHLHNSLQGLGCVGELWPRHAIPTLLPILNSHVSTWTLDNQLLPPWKPRTAPRFGFPWVPFMCSTLEFWLPDELLPAFEADSSVTLPREASRAPQAQGF